MVPNNTKIGWIIYDCMLLSCWFIQARHYIPFTSICCHLGCKSLSFECRRSMCLISPRVPTPFKMRLRTLIRRHLYIEKAPWSLILRTNLPSSLRHEYKHIYIHIYVCVFVCVYIYGTQNSNLVISVPVDAISARPDTILTKIRHVSGTSEKMPMAKIMKGVLSVQLLYRGLLYHM